MPLSRGVQLVIIGGVAAAGVSWTWWRGRCRLSKGTVCKLLLARGVRFVLFGSVAVADEEVDMVAGVVRFV